MDLLTASQAAELLHVSRYTIWRWTKNGLLKSVQSPSGRNRYSVEEVNLALEKAGLPLYIDPANLPSQAKPKRKKSK